MNVNIYIKTTAKAPVNKNVGFGYVLEVITSKGPATYSYIGTLEEATKNEAEGIVLLEALKHLKEPYTVTLYTDADYTAAVFTKYLPRWFENGFKNQRGEPVSDTWKQLAIFLSKKLTSVEHKKAHSYSGWLEREIEKKKAENAEKIKGGQKA